MSPRVLGAILGFVASAMPSLSHAKRPPADKQCITYQLDGVSAVPDDIVAAITASLDSSLRAEKLEFGSWELLGYLHDWAIQPFKRCGDSDVHVQITIQDFSYIYEPARWAIWNVGADALFPTNSTTKTGIGERFAPWPLL